MEVSVGEPTDEKLVQDYVSTLYTKRYSGTGFLYHSRIVTTMLEGIKFRHGRHSDSVLDVGCGTGFVSQLYPNFDVVGIDVSDGMLQRNPYRWIKASAEEIPFEDNHFDFVVCRSLLHHLEHPEKGLAEMFRVLKPGGQWACWETNFSVINDWVRRIAKHTKRFSHWHKNFKSSELTYMVRNTEFQIESVRYYGYVAYPLAGFPDILNLHLPISVGRLLCGIDNLISKTPLAPLGWSVMVKAIKL